MRLGWGIHGYGHCRKETKLKSNLILFNPARKSGIGPQGELSRILNMKTRTDCQPLAWVLGLFLWTIVSIQTVHAQSMEITGPVVNWADWTSDTVANPGGSATGYLTVDGRTANVSYSGEVSNQTQTNGLGTDYYTPVATYTNSIVPNPPTNGMITFAGGSTETITFSQAVTNPVMAIVSEGSPGITVSFTFNAPFSIIDSGPGWWGSGPALTQTGDTLYGAESDGLIQFNGVFTSISWAVSTGDTYYNGITIGVPTGQTPFISGIAGGNAVIYAGQPWSFTASGSAGQPFTNQWSFDGVNLANGTRIFGVASNILTFTNTVPADSGTYTFTITNAIGVASSNVTLTVLPDSAYNTFNTYASDITNLSGLLGYWRFDPTYRLNSCVNGYTGTPYGAAAIGAAGSGAPLFADPDNQGLLLDGSTAFIGTDLTGQIGNQGSLLAWVYLAAEPSVIGHFFSVVNQSQVGNNFDIQIETDNSTKFYAGNATAIYSQPLATGQWYFLAATLNSSGQANLYCDGQLVATASGGGHSVSGNPVSIGESQVFTGRFFDGRIDEVAVYNVALTPAQIAALYAAAQPPRLNISLARTNVVLSWPTNAVGFSLQSSGGLGANTWTTPLCCLRH